METLASAKAGVSRPLNLRESIYEMLRTRIRQGEISVDDKLVDHDIAKFMRVSRMPVREALLQLKSEGTLESTSRGFMLRRYTPQEISEVFEIRFLLEPPAAAEAARHANSAGLARMKDAVDHAEAAQRSSDWVAFMRSGGAYRRAWLDMVPNRALAETIGRCFDQAQIVRLAIMRYPAVRETVLECLRGSYEAFASGDATLIKERAALYARRAADCYRKNYRGMSAGAAN
jgi:DNA-binding GntR family transcriptional regulator